MKTQIKFFLFIALLTGFLSCTNDPDPVGLNVVPKEDRLSSDVIDSYTDNFDQTFTSFKYDSLSYGSSPTILLGNYKNIKSEALIGFYINLPDSILNSFAADSINLVSSYVSIRTSYSIGDKSNFRISLYRINRSWNPSTITQDTLDLIHSNEGSDLLDQSTFSINDSIMKFDVDKDLVRGWIQRTYDSTAAKDYGMLLSPSPSSGSAIVGFQGLTSYPFYQYPTLYMIFEKPGEFIDTVLAIPSIDVHFAEGNIDPDPSGTVLLQSTLGVRGKLKFDLSQVPHHVFINKATLDLYTDDTQSDQGSPASDSLAISFLTNFDNATVSSEIGQYRLTKSNNKYSGDIRLFVQKWIDGEDNQGLLVNLTDELRSVNKVAIFNSIAAVDSLQPRLTIYYTK